MDQQKNWQKILELIKKQISPANYRTWFSHTSLENLTDDTLTLSVPSAFVKGQLIARYQSVLSSSLQTVIGRDLVINFLIDSSKSLKKTASGEISPIDEADIFDFNPRSNINPISILNPKYTIESFVVGLTNNLAYAAAQAIVQNPGSSYNPLFIYGPSGVGKTHLMQAIGNALLKKNPYLKLVFVSSERFMVDFVESIQNKATGAFRQKYRFCNILLIDDIQFIGGKDSTQEEFFHTFNELQAKNAQIVLTSDRQPHDIQKLESRLSSRFQGGLMVDIQLPDFDTRIAILKAKLNEKGEAPLPEEVLSLIAENVISNTRELEGKLIQVLQMTKHSGIPPTLETVQNLLGSHSQTQKKNIDHKKILSNVNLYFNTKLSDLTGPRRQKGLVLPRQIAMFLMYEECRLPMERIGEILGGRDHTTVLHGIEKIRQALNRDREIQRLMIELKQQLTG